MKHIILLAFLLVPAGAYAIVGSADVIYGATAITADANGSSVKISAPWFGGGRNLLLRLEATKNSGTDPTLDVEIQHSPDCTTWSTLIDFTQVTTETGNVEDVHVTETSTVVFPCLRAVIDVGGTSPNYDATVTAYLD